MIFQARPLRFEFEAGETVWFPPGKALNTFRGALGMVLTDGVFAPQSGGAGPSGFEDRPRPFVLRSVSREGPRLTVDMNVFDEGAVGVMEQAVARISQLGPERGPVKFREARRLDPVEIDLAPTDLAPTDLAPTGAVQRVRVRFLTPMELKYEGVTLREPHFPALFARARDRVSTLCTVYQGGVPDADYRGLGENSRLVTMTASRVEQVEVERRSSRTGQRHGLGGFTGEAEYIGALGEFLPWLKAAEWTGVGRYTVWGNGALIVTGVA
jgi:hypothetical protein